MTKSWRLITHGEYRGAWNMAVDEALLISTGASSLPTLRFYMWDPTCISLGYFQKAMEIDWDKCGEEGIDVVRRPTGGRAVLHRNELTYSVILPLSVIPGSILDTYETISNALARGLRYLGLPAELSPSKGRVPGDTAACFDAPGSSEITIRGKKAIGSAQTRRGETLLQHGSIPLYNDYGLLTSLLTLSEDRKGRLARILEKKATCLGEMGYSTGKRDDYLNHIKPLQEAILRGFEEEMDIVFNIGELTDEEQNLTRKLLDEKYDNMAWTEERGHTFEKI